MTQDWKKLQSLTDRLTPLHIKWMSTSEYPLKVIGSIRKQPLKPSNIAEHFGIDGFKGSPSHRAMMPRDASVCSLSN